jgi:hypothetical protein
MQQQRYGLCASAMPAREDGDVSAGMGAGQAGDKKKVLIEQSLLFINRRLPRVEFALYFAPEELAGLRLQGLRMHHGLDVDGRGNRVFAE